MAFRSLLHFNGVDASTTITDDAGLVTWSVTADAQLDTAQQKFGSASLLQDGTGDFVRSSAAGAIGGGTASGWTIGFWARFNALTGTPVLPGYFRNGSNFVGVRVAGNGASSALSYFLSSTGTTDNIVSGAAGTKSSWVTGTWYHFAYTYDPVDAKYYFYVDGVLDRTVVSSTEVYAGADAMYQLGGFGSSLTQPFNGWIDEFYVANTCLYPGGTTFTPPSAELAMPTTPLVGSMAFTGIAPVLSFATVITPSAGSLVLTGQLATASNSGQRNIAPPTGSLVLSGAVPGVLDYRFPASATLVLTGAAPAVNVGFTLTPATGSLALSTASPVLGANARAVLQSYSATGTAHGGAIGAAVLQSYSATGEVTDSNAATGAATMRTYSSVGYAAYASNPRMREYSATGRASTSAIGAATLRAYRAQQISGAPRLRKYQVAAYATSVVASTYRTHVMNTTNNAVTEYTGFRFSSFAQIAGAYYGAGPDGLYRLDGSTDAGSNINWQARTGQIDDKQPGLKRLPEVVMGLRASGPVRVRVYPDDDRYYDYMLPNVKTTTIRQQRVKVGKGMKSRWFMVELQGVANAAMEMDSMQLNMTPTTRRIG